MPDRGRTESMHAAAWLPGKAMKEGRKDDAQKAKDEVAVLKEEQKALAEELARTEEAIRNELLNIPNIPYSGVPEGKTAADNVEEARPCDLLSWLCLCCRPFCATRRLRCRS